MTKTLIPLLILLIATTTHALPPDAGSALHKKITPSLVAVQYTYDGELGRREFIGAGVVVSDDGLVMTSINLMPIVLPDEQMKEFKLLIPGDEDKEIPAVFTGRDERSNTAFVKASDPSKHKWLPVKFEDIPVSVGDEIISVGLLGKSAAYQSYLTHALVSANLRGEIRHVLVTPGGVGGVGSPVFNADGKAIGWVPMQQGQVLTLNDPNPQNQLLPVYTPPRMFVPTREFSISLKDPPVAGKPLQLPWIGVARMTGLKKDVAEFFGLVGQPAVQVGDVIPNTPAHQAGLKPGAIIVKFNGQPLERGDEPDEAAMILMKKVKQMKVGDQLTFAVISESGKPPTDIQLTLAPRPMQENQARRYYAEDLGFTARQIVFDDTYQRKLPADQKGVVVALVKPAGAAQTGKLQRGDLITKLNQTPITDVEQFKTAYQEARKNKPREAVVLEAIRGGNDEIIRIEPPQ